jgi:hypothetical protein
VKRTVIIWAAAGFAVASALTALDFFAFDTASHMFPLFLVLWPASCSLMAIEDPHGAGWLTVLFSALIIHNAFLYGLLGLGLVSVKRVIRRPSKDLGYRERPYGIMEIATGFGAAGFVIALILGVVGNYATSFPSALYQCLTPAPYVPIEAGRHDPFPSLVFETVLRGPANAAIYFAVGLLAGGIWRLIKKRRPGNWGATP